jgi:hypothetical protein
MTRAHVTASIRFTLKDPDKEFFGLCGSNIAVGKKHPLELHELLYSMVLSSLEFYTDTIGRTMPADKLNDEVQKAAKLIGGLVLERDEAIK